MKCGNSRPDPVALDPGLRAVGYFLAHSIR